MVKALSNIRVSAGTAIVRDGHILLIEFRGKNKRLHYKLPAGGVNEAETVEEAAIRETREETEAVIQLGRLLLVWEYEPKRYKNQHGLRHKIGFVFQGTLAPDSQPRMPKKPDKGQTNVVWMPLDHLPHVKLIPPIAIPLLDALSGDVTLFYTDL